MGPGLREVVRKRAGDSCEYCRMPQEATPLIPFHVEHIVSRQHGGSNDPNGLALACDRCNAYKGPNLTSIDPETQAVVALFNPRESGWSEHFAVRGGHILGVTPTGRATVRLLNMNAPRRVELREECRRDTGWRF
jgi:HNH endonuclease